MAAWNAKDIEAECWLEASSRLECPVSQLAMDYAVRIADNKQLMAEVLVCQSDLVRRSVLLFSSIGLNIDVISNQSRRPADAGL